MSMTFNLKKITIRTKNNPEGIKSINEVYDAILTGDIPLLFNSDKEVIDGVFPISEYSNYESDENGEYDLSIIATTYKFIEELENDENFVKFHVASEDVSDATMQAWQKVWEDESLKRSYEKDYEFTMPAHLSEDEKAHCYLYIGVKI